MKNFRIIVGAVLGFLLCTIAYLTWFFSITHQNPWDPATPVFMAETAAFGVVFALVGGYLASLIAADALGSHFMALILFLISAWNIWETWRQFSTFWAPIIAILFMTPAAWIGGHIHRRRSA